MYKLLTMFQGDFFLLWCLPLYRKMEVDLSAIKDCLFSSKEVMKP